MKIPGALLIAVLTMFSACKSMKYMHKGAFSLVSIEAKDLSEDLSVFSTKSDELLISAFIMSFEDQGTVIWDTALPTIYLDTNKLTQDLNLSLVSDTISDFYIVISMVELDDENTEKTTHEKIKNRLANSTNTWQTNSGLQDFFDVDSLIGDNDFLGYVVLQTDDFYFLAHPEHHRVISGNHLLDKYEYHLHFKKQPYVKP